MKKNLKRKGRVKGVEVAKQHDILNESYARKLKGMDNILLNETYWNYAHKQQLGEVDAFSYRERSKTAYILETKLHDTSKTRNKAITQIDRARKIFVPRYERKYNCEIERVVGLYASNHGLKCMGITYRETFINK